MYLAKKNKTMETEFNLSDFVQKVAEEMGGQLTDYDANKSILILPVDDHRYQSVVCRFVAGERFNDHGVEFTSKVCKAIETIDYKQLAIENAKLCYARFSLIDDFLKVESAIRLKHITEGLLKEMLIETSLVADEWEFKMTGKDVF